MGERAHSEWDRAGALSSQQFNLALLAAHSSVGLPLTKQTREWTEAEIDEIEEQNPDYPGDLRAQLESEPASPRFCSAFGQARAVVAVWLPASALERGEEALASQLGDAPTRRIFWIPIDAINGSTPTLIEGVPDLLRGRGWVPTTTYWSRVIPGRAKSQYCWQVV
ncbi:MAG TPA: hypothetical protein VM848_06120 [Acidimicrobiia bacterium]|nr:hypothetical protein [Acidimicrobiia bacterium]